MHRTRFGALAAFHQPRRAVAAGAPQAATLPPGVGIVDAPVQSLREEAHRIRNAQHDHLAILERNESAVQVPGGDRDILAEAEGIVLVDPRVIARLGAVLLEARMARPGETVVSEAFRAMVAGRVRSVERSLALA